MNCTNFAKTLYNNNNNKIIKFKVIINVNYVMSNFYINSKNSIQKFL